MYEIRVHYEQKDGTLRESIPHGWRGELSEAPSIGDWLTRDVPGVPVRTGIVKHRHVVLRRDRKDVDRVFGTVNLVISQIVPSFNFKL